MTDIMDITRPIFAVSNIMSRSFLVSTLGQSSAIVTRIQPRAWRSENRIKKYFDIEKKYTSSFTFPVILKDDNLGDQHCLCQIDRENFDASVQVPREYEQRARLGKPDKDEYHNNPGPGSSLSYETLALLLTETQYMLVERIVPVGVHESWRKVVGKRAKTKKILVAHW